MLHLKRGLLPVALAALAISLGSCDTDSLAQLNAARERIQQLQADIERLTVEYERAKGIIAQHEESIRDLRHNLRKAEERAVFAEDALIAERRAVERIFAAE